MMLEPLRRGSGLAGLVVAAGGAAGLAAVAVPWWEARAELEMLGATQARAVTAIAGWQHLPGVAVGTVASVAVVLGLLLAFDRHPSWTRPAALLAAAVAAGVGAWGAWWTPDLGRFPDGDGSLADLRELAGTLPQDVALSLRVTVGAGVVLAVSAGAAVLLGTLAARDLDRR